MARNGKSGNREAIFKVYASNLSACFPRTGVRDTFLCPFCRQAFGLEALKEPPKVIIAHCIPKSVGGKLKSMACVDCDNSAGAMIEVHLKNRLETQDFFDAVSSQPRKLWVTVGSEKVRAELKLSKDQDGKPTFSVFLEEKNSNPKAFSAALDLLKKKIANGERLQLQLQGSVPFNPQKAKIAELRAAFLMMFRYFGYSYILHPVVERVRQQILRPNEEIIPGPVSLYLNESDIPSNRVAIVKSPIEYRSFLVSMRLSTERGKSITKGVIMPGLGNDSGLIYERMIPCQQAIPQFRADYSLIKYEPGRLAKPEAVSLPYELWGALGTF